MAVLFYMPVVLGSLLYLLVSGGEYALRMRTFGESPLTGLAAGLAAAAAMVVMTRWLVPRAEPLQRVARALASFTGPMSWSGCVVLATSSALGEELLFRAVLQEQLGFPIALLLFAAVHVPSERDLWLWPITALATGSVLGLLYELTGAALAPAVAHLIWNLVILRWIGQNYVTERGGTGSAT